MNDSKETNPSPIPLRNERLDATLSNVLRMGTIAAAAIILLGVVWSWIRPSTGAPVDVHRFVKGGTEGGSTDVFEVVRNAFSLDARSIVLLGVVALLLTPMFRVFACATVFAVQRDRLYTAISLLVGVTLILGMLGIIE